MLKLGQPDGLAVAGIDGVSYVGLEAFEVDVGGAGMADVTTVPAGSVSLLL